MPPKKNPLFPLREPEWSTDEEGKRDSQLTIFGNNQGYPSDIDWTRIRKTFTVTETIRSDEKDWQSGDGRVTITLEQKIVQCIQLPEDCKLGTFTVHRVLKGQGAGAGIQTARLRCTWDKK